MKITIKTKDTDISMPVPLAMRLGIFAQSKFHRGRGFKQHLVYDRSRGLHCQELSGDWIGAARAGKDSGHAPGTGLLKAAIQRIYTVQRPQLRCTGIG